MKLNMNAFGVGCIILYVLNILYVLIVTEFISEMPNEVFPYVSIIVIVLSIPILAINCTWFFCVVKYFDNGFASKSFAKPDKNQNDSLVNRFVVKNHRTQLYLIIGSFLALLISSYSYVTSYNKIYKKADYIYQTSMKTKARNTLLPTLSSLAQYLKNTPSAQTAIQAQNCQGEWQKVFTSGLFNSTKEQSEYDNKIADIDYMEQNAASFYKPKLSQLKMQSEYNVISKQFKDIRETLMKNADMYEFWIDPENQKHVKTRIHVLKQTRTIQTNIGNLTMDATYIPVKGIFDFQYNFVGWIDYSDYLVYDSDTDDARYVNGRFWVMMYSNIYIPVVIVLTYFLMFIICFQTKVQLRKIAQSGILNGQKKFKRNYKASLKNVKRTLKEQKLLPCPPKLQHSETQDDPKDDI